ncbi:MAG: FAD-dependent oxidoreductase [Solirubrobacterales bacterium]
MISWPAKPARIAIVGGGVAALEAMLALGDRGGDLVEIDMFSPQKDFSLKPLGVSDAFGQGEVPKFDLESIAEHAGAKFHMKSVKAIDAHGRRVVLHDGDGLTYDYLIVSTGTKALWVVPGAKTFWGLQGKEVVAEVLEMVRTGKGNRLALTMPDPAVWPLPVYELALFFATEFKDEASHPKITIVTPEGSPLGVFGTETSRFVEGLLYEHGIDLVTDTVPVSFANGQLTTDSGSINADVALTLPRLTGRRIEGLPFGEDGFLPVDGFGLIAGMSREYAAGDVISYPVKFGGLATEQADVVAAAIASRAWDKPPPDPFRPRMRGTLLTSDGPVHLGEGAESKNGTETDWDPGQKVVGRYLSPLISGKEN